MKNLEHSAVDPKLVALILNNVADGVFTVDPQFKITFFNHAAETITGFTADEAMGKACFEVFRTGICGHDCPLRQSLRAGRTIKNVEIEILTRRGRRQTINVSTAPLVDQSGQFLGGVETFRDITPVKALRREINRSHSFRDIVSKTPCMLQIFATLPSVAHSQSTVLIRGNQGTGKDLLATAIHNESPRFEGPLIKVNCSAFPPNLLETELFGQVTGGVGDAQDNLLGRFQAAQGGTLFLDEIAALPEPVQMKLVRAIDRHEFEVVGSDKTIRADVRIIVSTSQDLERLVAEGGFREDLYNRLNVVQVKLPDLCERREDIPLLVEAFIERFNVRLGRAVGRIADEAMAMLVGYAFPGNVRELENAVEHAYIMSSGPTIMARDLPAHILNAGTAQLGHARRASRRSSMWREASADRERQELIDSLERNHWSIPRTAQELGVHRTTLWRKVKRLQIEGPLS